MSAISTSAESPSARERKAHPDRFPIVSSLVEVGRGKIVASAQVCDDTTLPESTVILAQSCFAARGSQIPLSGQDLSSPGGKWFNVFPEMAAEMSYVCAYDYRAGFVYFKAVRSLMENEGVISCCDPESRFSNAGRYAVYKHLGVQLRTGSKRTPGEASPYPPALGELLDRDTLFDAVLYGKLGVYGRIMLMPSARYSGEETKRLVNRLSSSPCSVLLESGRLEMDRIGEPISKVTIASREASGMLFLKACSLQPENFASALLSDTGLIVPKLRSVGFRKPDGKPGEYALIRHVASNPDVRMSCQIGSLKSNHHIASFLRHRSENFAATLGSALETCRLFGIQDRHPGNVWVAITPSGKIRIAMIDLDLVGCYPYEAWKYQQEYAARIRSLALHLSEIFPGGRLPDGSPAALNLMKGAFLEGAAAANASVSQRDNEIAQIFEMQDGYAVGVFCRLGFVMERFPHSENGPVSFNAINGPERQRLIVGGPDSGRFVFNADMAWKHGYSVQRSISSRAFWEPVFTLASGEPPTNIIY